NWFLSTPPSNNQTLVQITNATSKFVTINATTTNSPGTMTISNLLISAPAGTTNELQLTNPGTNVPLRILNLFALNAGGSLAISNGAVQMDGGGFVDDGQVVLSDPTAKLIVVYP